MINEGLTSKRKVESFDFRTIYRSTYANCVHIDGVDRSVTR